jgi:alcohol dehydrogenase, propanol-preferring
MRALRLTFRGLIRAEFTKYTLDNGMQAYRDLHDGKIAGRAVIVP